MTRKKIIAIITLVVFLFSMTAFGCGKKKGGAKKPLGMGGKQQKIIVGVSLADSKDESGKLIKQGMQQSAKNEKDVQLKFSDAGKDSTKQEEEIDKLIQQKPKVIILQVVDPETGKNVVRRIMQKKIKVIAIEQLPKDVAIDGYIASDFTRAGEIAGDFTTKQMIGKPASVMLLKGETTDTQTQNVTAGLTKSLGAMPIQTTPIPRSEPQTATTAVQQKITAGGIGAIIATNSQLSTAAADAVKMQNKSGQLIVVGVGGGSKAAQAIKSGDMTAIVDTQALLVGQTAFKAALDLAKTQRWDFERNIKNDSSDIPAKLIPVRLVTKENAFLLEAAGGSSSGGSSGSSGEKDKKKKQDSSSQGGSGGSSGGSDSQSGSGGQSGSGQGGGQQNMTKVRITTEDGKTMEITVKGKIKKIESAEGGAGGGGQSGSSSGGGESGSSGDSGGGGQ